MKGKRCKVGNLDRGLAKEKREVGKGCDTRFKKRLRRLERGGGGEGAREVFEILGGGPENGADKG